MIEINQEENQVKMIQLNQEDQAETQAFKKLQQIVPTIPKEGQVSDLDIIENVIQYIMVLQNELEQEPTHTHSNSSLLIQERTNRFNANLEGKTI